MLQCGWNLPREQLPFEGGRRKHEMAQAQLQGPALPPVPEQQPELPPGLSEAQPAYGPCSLKLQSYRCRT